MIEFHGAEKAYRSLIPPRTTRALQDLTLTIEQGEVFGIAGSNGAGKTTMLGLVMGFVRPTAGSVTVDGLSPRRYAEAHGVSYVSEITAIPQWWLVTGALRRYALLAGVPTADRPARVEAAIGALGLEEQRGKRIKQLSKGNLQRVGIAQALLRESRLMVFDEPTHGLDPVWTQRFRDVVQRLRSPARSGTAAFAVIREPVWPARALMRGSVEFFLLGSVIFGLSRLTRVDWLVGVLLHLFGQTMRGLFPPDESLRGAVLNVVLPPSHLLREGLYDATWILVYGLAFIAVGLVSVRLLAFGTRRS